MRGLQLLRIVEPCFLIGIAFVWAVPSANAQVNSNTSNLVLVARVTDAAGLQWHSRNVTQLLDERGLLARGADGKRAAAHLIVLQSNLLFAVGQSVRAEARLEGTASRDAELFALETPGDTPDMGAYGFLPRSSVTRLSLLDSFDPRAGSQQHVKGLLVFATDAPDPKNCLLRITLSAF